MSIQDDQTARVMAQANDDEAIAAESNAGDLRAILNLIAAQLEDADRRQSEVLDDMHRRLARMGDNARVASANVPEEFAPAFGRIQDGIELLAQLVAGADDRQSIESREKPADRTEGPARDEPVAGWNSDSEREAPPAVSSIFPSPALPHPNEADASADDMMITDNAADRMEYADRSASAALYADPEYGFGSPSTAGLERRQHEEAPVVSDRAAHDRHNPVAADDWDQVSTWNADEAEALARVYEAHDVQDAAIAEALSHHRASRTAEFAQAAILTGDAHDDHAATDETAYGKEDLEMLPHEPESRTFHEAAFPQFAPVIEQAWLEERFAEIAAKIEESILEFRDDHALTSLSDRFGEFEERIGLALEDVAARHDVDALKSAEAQIDSMVGYFERVEAQLGRIDSLEAQMETLIERFSDDNMAHFFAGQPAAEPIDYSQVAEAAAESVAQRFLSEFAGGALGGQGGSEALMDMREALAAFVSERRERDDESAGMLDTIQQALLRVLDRVDVLESAYENAPMTSPLDDDIEHGAAEFTGPDASAEYEDDAEADEAPVQSAPRAQRHQPTETDYQQARLEYPAAVRASRPVEEPLRRAAHVEPDFAHGGDELRDDVGAFDEDTVNDAAYGDAAGLPVDEHDFAQSGHSDELAPPPYETGQHEPQRQAQPDLQQSVAGNPIERLRQDFIADARRARERASQQALLGLPTTEEEQPPAKKGFAIPGLSSLGSLGKGAAKTEPQAAAPVARTAPVLPASPAAPLPATRAAMAGRAKVAATEEPAPSSSRFALPRSRLLVGAVIVLFATAGALLMLRSPSKPISETAPVTIEQKVEQAPGGPELTGPDVPAPASTGETTPDRRSDFDGGRVYDGNFGYEVPDGGDIRSMERSLAGLAITDLDKAPDPVAFAKIREQQRVAKLSSELAAAAAYPVPANLIEEQPSTGSPAAGATSIARGGDGNHLNLPPATVGPLSLRLAAAKGDPSAQFEVAARLAGGSGTQQDLKGAVKWYQMAAAQGFAQAQYRLGTLYERGLGVDKDLARASVWYQRAAEKGNVKAMHNLAVVSAGRTEGGPDYKTAAKWFDAAAQYGLSDSQFNMAVLHENGLGVEANLPRAYLHYSLAAAKGDTQAKTRRDAVRAMLSPGELETVERQVEGFRAKMADRLVNDARVAGEDWKKRADGGY
ncbi:MAG: sel1 repeat family protein [Alphaproteobacteria bacterium]|nr:sel1 repeat family protein [Alphaproteobacteria bacterium]